MEGGACPFHRWPPPVAWLRPLPGAGLSGPNGFTSPNLNPNPTRLSGPWGHRVGRRKAGFGLRKPCAACHGSCSPLQELFRQPPASCL